MANFIILASGSQFYFNLKADNNETVLTSERYVSKAGCLTGIQSVKQNAPKDERYKRLLSSNGQFYFNLSAENGKVIGTSEMYTRASARDEGIEVVKRIAPTAGIEDRTVG